MEEQNNKENIKNSKKTLGFKLKRIFWIVVLFILSLPVLIHFGPIQNLMINRVSSQLTEKTDHRITVGKVDFSIFKGMIFKEVFVSEFNSDTDTLAYIGEFSSSLEENILSLLDNKIHLSDINLFDVKLNVIQERGEDMSNLDKFLSQLVPANTKVKESDSELIDLNLRNINLRNIQLYMDNRRSDQTIFASLNEGHIGVEKLNFAQDSFLFHSISLYRPECIIAEIDSIEKTIMIPDSVKVLVDSISSSNEWFLKIGVVEIDDGLFQRVKGSDLINESTGNSLDVNDLNVSGLNMIATDLSLNTPLDINARIEALSLEEHNGLSLQDLKVDSFVLNDNQLLLKDFNLLTEESNVKDYLEFKFGSLEDFKDFTSKVKILSDMGGSDIALNDLAYFIPGLQGSRFLKANAGRKVNLTGAFNGSINELEVSNLYLTINDLVELSGELSSSNLTDPDNAMINLYVEDLRTSLINLRKVIPGFTPPPQFYKLDPISFTGDIEGFITDIVIYGNLNSRLGNVILDTRLNTKSGVAEAEYSGEIALQDFDLRRWTGNDDFGHATLSARIQNGYGLTLEKVKTDLQAELDSFEFKDYVYTNVSLEGFLEKGLFDGIFTVKDPNVDVDFQGQIAIKEHYFNSDFEATIFKIDPSAINLSPDYSDVTGNLKLSIEGETLNEFSGSAELNNLNLTFREKEFEFNQVYFSSSPGTKARRNMILSSDILNASIDGSFDFKQLVPAFKNYISDHHPQWAKQLKIEVSDKKLTKDQKFSFKFEVFDTKDYLELVKVDQFRIKGLNVEGSINLPENKFETTVSIDSSSYKNYRFNSFGLALTNNRKISKLLMDLESVVSDSKQYEPLNIKSELNGDDIHLEIKTQNVLDSVGYVDLALNISPLDDKIRVNIINKDLQMFSKNWEIDESNEIIYGKNYLSIKDFVLSDGYRAVLIQDYKKSGIEFNLENFDFLLINGLINYDKIDFAGEGSVYARVANIFKKPSVVADVRIPEFTLNKVDYGALFVRLDDDGDKAYAHVNLSRIEDDLRLLLNAELDKETKTLSGDVTARNMVMKTFEFIIDDGISKTEGITNIDAKLSGTLDDIQLDGTANVIGGQTRIDYIGTLIDLGTETFTVTEDFIDLTGVSLFDKFGNQATMTGGLRHDLFGDFRTDLNMRSNRFLALDTEKVDNPVYYGTGLGPISIDFNGPFSSTDIIINATTGPGTVLNIPIEDSYSGVDESFIKYVPRDEVMNPEAYSQINEAVKLEGVDVDMNLTMTEDAQVNLIFDERLNDIIKGEGNGDLRITIARDGKFNIYGEYEIERGEYLFTAWGIVSKPFIVRRGGLITWTGDPINANLNLEADYDDLRAPVNVLLAEYLVTGSTNLEQEARKRTRIDLTLKLGGTLYNPVVNFDIDFPELQGELRTYADSKMITLRENDADLNEQVAGLIMFRSFLPSSSLGNVFTTSNSFVETTYNTLSEFVSNQLSYLLSGFLQEALTDNGFVSGIDFEIGFSKNSNILGGAPQSDNYLPDEIEVHFKPRFQNDKWGFDYGTSFVNSNSQSTSVISNYVIHDFILEYYLTTDRRLKLRAYGKWDKNEFDGSNEQKYGMGLNYRKEFGSLTKFKSSLTEDISRLVQEENED